MFMYHLVFALSQKKTLKVLICHKKAPSFSLLLTRHNYRWALSSDSWRTISNTRSTKWRDLENGRPWKPWIFLLILTRPITKTSSSSSDFRSFLPFFLLLSCHCLFTWLHVSLSFILLILHSFTPSSPLSFIHMFKPSLVVFFYFFILQHQKSFSLVHYDGVTIISVLINVCFEWLSLIPFSTHTSHVLFSCSNCAHKKIKKL
jgi:hypothetical protein